MLPVEAIEFYHDHPYEFFVDILKTQPDSLQKKILEAIPEAIKKKEYLSVRAGHGVLWEKHT